LPGTCVITREIAVADGVFAPGHLGELTQIVPFEMAGAVLADSGGTQRRLRKLPARVVACLLLAAALFEQAGYLAVWRKLTGPLESLPIPKITATALWHARTRLGPGPLQALFDLLRGPAAAPGTTGTRWSGMLVCAIDGTCLDVPDSPRCRARYRKGTNQYATAGYPQIRLTALVACGTRAVIDAAFGPCTRGETVYGQQLMRCLHENMIVLLDRGFAPTPSWAPSPAPAPTSWPACQPPANHRSCAATRTAPSCPRSARSRSGSSSARSPSPPPPGGRPGSTAWPPPCSTRTSTRRSS